MADIKDFLNKLGVDPKTVEDEKANLDELVEQFHEKQREEIVKVYKNSDDYKTDLTEFEGKLYAKHQKILDGAIKKSGLVLTDEQAKSKPQEKIELLVKHLQENDNSKKEVSDMQKELMDWKNKYSDLEESSRQKIEQAFSEADKKLITDKTNILVKQKFISIPKERIVGGAQSDGKFIGLKAFMDTKYDFSIDEKGDLIPYLKGTTQRVTAKVNGKEDFVGIDDIMKNSLKELDLWVEGNGTGGGPTPPPKPAPAPVRTGSALPQSRLEQMQQKAAAE